VSVQHINGQWCMENLLMLLIYFIFYMYTTIGWLMEDDCYRLVSLIAVMKRN